MIPQRRFSQRQYRRRKKHSLVIRVRDQETNALVPQFGEAAFRYAYCVIPRCHQYERKREEREPFHDCSVLELEEWGGGRDKER
jgi:hypothetical protein